MDGVYVFCSIPANENPVLNSVEFAGEERDVYTISHKDTAMIVADMPMQIYHPKKDNLKMHQQVISNVMEQVDSVVPISFGNIFHSRDDVKALLESLYPQLIALFPKIKGKIEVGLKVIGKKEWLETEIYKNPNIEKQQRTVESKSEAAGYFDRIQLGEMAQDFFKKLQAKIETEIHDELAPIADANQINDPIGEKMLLNGAYLVDRDKEELFDQKVNELHDKWKDHVDFKYTGPWPAYNFINIKLKVEQPS
ncbi:GvpL/GvpF family gas vesicle protein [Virgibacillus kekensis]|uniref:GvpL/GvpF family gas vesicle protein n=1 Tax=Virgibacillus kekensis TaxID=202261 RepID=A0ABV9DGT1_9BACI